MVSRFQSVTGGCVAGFVIVVVIIVAIVARFWSGILIVYRTSRAVFCVPRSQSSVGKL